MSSKKTDVAIIGGGVIGLCTAYYLNKAGISVTIIEKKQPGFGSSFGNAGLISPSHFVPLAAPGMVAKGLKWMFDAESPFYIHPRPDIDLITWLWKFMRASTDKRMRPAMPVLRDMTLASQQLFHTIANEESFDFALEQKGLILLHDTAEGEKAHHHEVALANEVGVTARMISREEIHQMQPGVKVRATGGVFFPQDGHLIPDQFNAKLTSLLQTRGVQFMNETDVFGFVPNGKAAGHLRTSEGGIHADQYVVAAGAWTSDLLYEIGIALPVQAGKGYSVTVKREKNNLTIPIICTEARVAITPMGDTIRYAGTLELSGNDLTINPRRVKAILRAADRYLENFNAQSSDIQTAWAGLRPCSPDGLPFIGRFKRAPNVIAATGHAMLGITLGPITGKLVSEIVTNAPQTIISPLLDADRYV